MASVFVFGSNLLGIHGAGAAKLAKEQYGAQDGCSVGRTGNAYAIPTKKSPWGGKLPLSVVGMHIQEFLDYAREHPEDSFILTTIGCGHAGHLARDVGPLFKTAPPNVLLPGTFKAYCRQNP
jgi:hypothetical protein